MKERVVKSGPRAGYVSLEAVNPADGKPWEVYVGPKRQQAVSRRGVHAVMEMAYGVTEVLLHPRKVYEGIRWDGDEDVFSSVDSWLCYVGIPIVDFRTPDSKEESDPRPGRVLLVFVNKEWVAYNWRWEDCQPGTQDTPVGTGDTEKPRFKKQLL